MLFINTEAIKCLLKSIEIYTDMVCLSFVYCWINKINIIESVQINFIHQQGRFTIAAKHHVTIAEIYENDKVDIDKVNNKPLNYALYHMYVLNQYYFKGSIQNNV